MGPDVKLRCDEPIEFPRRHCGRGASPTEGVGCSAFMYDGVELDSVRDTLGRPRAWGKVFFKPFDPKEGTEGLSKYIWSGTHPPDHECNSLLLEATAIQNIAALYGMAPRVYGIFLVEDAQRGDLHPAQLCDYVPSPSRSKGGHVATFEALTKIGEKLGYKSFADLRGSNCRDDTQWVDFQGWRFMQDYEKRLAQRVQELGRFQGPKGSYQTVPEMSLPGRRDSATRIAQLSLDKLSFEGQTVLDLGCSTGAFCRYAIDRGAKRVVGIDGRKPVAIAAELSAYLGTCNADYIALDLRKTTAEEIAGRTGIKQFDIVFFLAMFQHVGFPEWISALCRGTLVFETNPHPGEARIAEVKNMLAQGFGNVHYMGQSGDIYPRSVFWAGKD